MKGTELVTTEGDTAATAEDIPFILDTEGISVRLGQLERKVNAQREIGLCTLGVTILVLYYITRETV